MSVTLAILDELAGALGEELPEALRAALARIEAAERGVTGVTPRAVTGDGVTRNAEARRPSAAALRQRRYRARKAAALAGRDGAAVPAPETHEVASPDRNAASPEASRVTSPGVTGDGGGDAWGKKKVSPHTPLQRKTPPTQKGFPGRRKRHRRDAGVAADAATPRTVFLDAHDARYREIVAMRGRSYPIHSGGWWFEAALVEEAERRLAAKVTPLRSSALAIAVATGPPGRFGVG